MHRSTLAVCVALAPLFSTARLGAEVSRPAGRPPSSFDARHGTVDFVHNRHRLVACHAERARKKLTCRAERRSGDAGLAIVVRPIRAPGLVGRDPREPVRFAIPSGPSPEDKAVRLGVGQWELEFTSPKHRYRFVVSDGDRYKVRLTTLNGSCRKVHNDCVADLAKVQHKVSIPASHRARPAN